MNRKEYQKEYQKKYRLDSKEKWKIYRLNNKDKISKAIQAYYLKNCNNIKEYAKNYRLNNLDKIKEYFLKNKDKMKEYQKEYNKIYRPNNRNLLNAHEAKRRASRLNATPKFADLNKIKEIYKNCPKGFHVDHIVPLQGKNVCGLHVEWNLQYLTANANQTKSNKLH